MEEVKQELRHLTESLGAIAFGVASSHNVDKRAPKGHRIKDLVPTASSVIVVAVPCANPAAFLSPNPRMATLSYMNTEYKYSAITAALEDVIMQKHGYYAVSLPQVELSGENPFVSLKLCAEEAGLGLMALNGQLMNPEWGTKIDFTAVATSMPLPPDVRLSSVPCPHEDCWKLWAEKKTLPCFLACPTGALSAKIRGGEVISQTYRQIRCMLSSQNMGPPRFIKLLEEILSTPDEIRRRQLLYGEEFRSVVNNIAYGVEVYASCNECRLVCPVGMDKFKLK